MDWYWDLRRSIRGSCGAG